MKRIRSFKFFRMIILALSLSCLPLTTPVYAQSNDNNNRGADSRRDDDRDRRDRDDRDRRDRDDDKDFPWGLLGLAGLLGLLGLRKPKREIYVDDRDYPPPPPPPRDVPPPRR